MTSQPLESTGPDLAKGVAIEALEQGKPLLGQLDGEAVILLRCGAEILAVAATCTHYGGPLAEGLVEGVTIRCPWHHACFDLRTGEPRAPALNPIATYTVERRGKKVHVLSKKPRAAKPAVNALPRGVVIVGGGAAGHAATETLRHEGYSGKITILSAEAASPVDRPNLSKDYLAGKAPEDWIPLRPLDFYTERGIELVLGARVESIDPKSKLARLENGTVHGFDALLLATGAEPVRLAVPGANGTNIHYLRSLDDCRGIIEKAAAAKVAVIIGASFIGLEVAAALRTRGLAVHVVAPDRRPLERIMGAEIGEFVRATHEQHGVVFHLGNTVEAITSFGVVLSSGVKVACDLMVVGIGVKPRLELAERAGLAVDRGVLVDEFLETTAPGVFAAGDIARWPDPHSGRLIRVEHWVVAQRQGQIAARNMLGQKRPCDLVPYFWSQHYDVAISYVGHAEHWDCAELSGNLAEQSGTAALRAGQRTLAVITIGRDLESLAAEVAFERNDEARLAAFGRE
jgi:apoptosis-inducing factor 3